jgi:pyruvate formate lyase activating enzyme
MVNVRNAVQRYRGGGTSMGHCMLCNSTSRLISSTIGVCAGCIRSNFERVKEHIESVHRKTRSEFGLPETPPKSKEGIVCTMCVNRCVIPEGGRGYCGLRSNREGRLVGGTNHEGLLEFYYDRLPTNCVASWVCPAGSRCGYPEYSYTEGPEYGYKNLAVFFTACSFNCLYCQNWHFRQRKKERSSVSAEQLARSADNRTSCICYFGGDPTPQLPYAIEASKLALAKLGKERSVLRICWETNGSMNPELLKEMVVLSLGSGGSVKFDLKAWDEGLHKALTGITNRRTLKNFETVAKYCRMRRDPPLLTASTLLVPGYIDTKEVSSIAKFIASLDPEIPYSLLAFAPNFYLHDLPCTSRKDAEACLDAAQGAGLFRVSLGNTHILR